MPKKHSQEYVASVFESRGFKLVGEYKENRAPIEAICPNNHKITVIFSNFSRGHGCRKCRDVETGDRQRRSLESVKQEFKKEGCILLETSYKNNQQPLRFKCVCGRDSKTSLANFQRGVRCYECGLNRLRGANNPKWNPDKKDRFRHTKEYKDWRKAVLSRDNYTCQKCGEYNWGIIAHHVFSFKSNEDIRYDVENGVSLCRRCHTDFHVQFGYNDNNWEQFMSFLTERGPDEDEPWFAGEVDESEYAEYLEETYAD